MPLPTPLGAWCLQALLTLQPAAPPRPAPPQAAPPQAAPPQAAPLQAAPMQAAPVQAAPVQAAPASGLAEVVVIGTLHRATPAFTPERLLEILQRLKPDVLLLELDASFFTADLRLRDYVSSSMEMKAVRAFLAGSPVQVRPFDVEGRNDFYARHDIFDREDALLARIRELDRTGGLGPEGTALWRSIQEHMARRDRWMAESPERLNGFACDADLAAKTWHYDQGLSELVRRVPALAGHAAFADLNRAFETSRNDAMVANIRRWVRAFPGRRLVVLTGFEHRHELRRQLAVPGEPATYVLREFWDDAPRDGARRLP